MLRFNLTRQFAIVAIALALVATSSSKSFGQAVTLTSEPELIKVLTSGPDEEKALACKRLAVYGSAACVPEVAKLLKNPQLSSWARITLEAIADDASKAALRDAASNLDGLQAVGAINSLGLLRDAAAIEILSTKLKSGSQEIASAAAYALGRIGTEASLTPLQSMLSAGKNESQYAIAEACVYCADHLLKSGNSSLAIKVYDHIRQGEFHQQRIVEATRGAILARGDAGVPILIEQLSSRNNKLFAVGLQTARELDSSKLEPALLEHLKSAPAERAALIVEALAEMKGKTDLPALQDLALNGSKEVRLAAITVLGRVGDVSCVDTLLSVAKPTADMTAAVRAALVAIPDDKVDAEILKRLSTSSDTLILIEVIGLRQLEATEELIKAVDSSDDAIRAAALQSLGQTVPQAKLSTLVSQVVSPKRATDAEGATRALKTAAIRMPDREACASTISAALKTAPAATKGVLLETVGAVGGTNALETVREFAMGKDQALRDTSTKLLGEWMSVDVAPVLLDIYTNGPKDQFTDRAMRGYARVVRQLNMPEVQRIEMCRTILSTAKLREQKLVFDVIKKFPSAATLQLALDTMKMPELAEDSKAAIESIKPKLANNKDAQELLKKAGLN